MSKIQTEEEEKITNENKNENKVCTFIKSKQRKGNIRKRKLEEESSTIKDNDLTTIISNKKYIHHGITLSTQDQKKKKEELDLTYEASGTAMPIHPTDQFVTAHLETETEHDKDAIAIKERGEKLQQTSSIINEDGVKAYRGLNAYSDYLEKKDKSGLIKGAGIRQPIRTSIYARAITRMDYQPDVCKDYKETGYCGFGDSCKFLHDRGDYKSSFELEKEWEEQMAAKKRKSLYKEEEEEQQQKEELPTICGICNQPFVEPVKTKCKHFFCEKCVIKEIKCPTCGESTGSSFSYPNIIEKKKLLSKK